MVVFSGVGRTNAKFGIFKLSPLCLNFSIIFTVACLAFIDVITHIWRSDMAYLSYLNL